MSDDVLGAADDTSTSTALEQLVGEGKKFATVEDLAKGKLAADAHVATLETEAASTKEQLEKLNKEKGTEYTVTDLMKAVKDATDSKEGDSDGAKPMSTEELQELIKSVIAGETATSTKDANRAKGNALVLDKAKGDPEVAKALVAERARAVGMSTQAMRELSEHSPDAFAKLMEIDSTQQAPGTGALDSVNTDLLNSGAVMEVDGHKTRSYFEAKRKEMGNLKYIHDAGLQAEMQRASQALGAKFNQ
jgi:hypothetical protein